MLRPLFSRLSRALFGTESANCVDIETCNQLLALRQEHQKLQQLMQQMQSDHLIDHAARDLMAQACRKLLDSIYPLLVKQNAPIELQQQTAQQTAYLERLLCVITARQNLPQRKYPPL